MSATNRLRMHRAAEECDECGEKLVQGPFDSNWRCRKCGHSVFDAEMMARRQRRAARLRKP